MRAAAGSVLVQRRIYMQWLSLRRPLLKIKPKDGGQMTTLTFVGAIARKRKRMTEADIGFAFGRAGISFKGQMQQNFVVLHEKGSSLGQEKAGLGCVPAVPTWERVTKEAGSRWEAKQTRQK